MSRSPMHAFLMAVFPGLGHYYVGRRVRPVLYGLPFIGLVFLFFLMAANGGEEEALVVFVMGVALWLVNMFDMVIFLLTRPEPEWPYRKYLPKPVQTPYPAAEGNDTEGAPYGPFPYPSVPQARAFSEERFRTLLLSCIPGLGHFHLGLMQRGAAFLFSFFGLFAMVLFLAVQLFGEDFLVFLVALPVIWLYNLFDTSQLLKRKENGEILEDRTIFEEFESGRAEGKKSKMLATLLAMFPGAGHMYLGLQRRGLQLMAGFLLTIYLMDVLRLSLFLFLVPIIWFFGFFDALQLISKQGREEVKDVPLVDWLMNHQKWIGFGLLALGGYLLFDQMILGLLQDYFPELRLSYWFHRYFQTLVVGTLLIGGGIRLLSGSRGGRNG